MPRASALTTIKYPCGVKRRIDEALDAGIGKVEGVEGARHKAKAH